MAGLVQVWVQFGLLVAGLTVVVVWIIKALVEGGTIRGPTTWIRAAHSVRAGLGGARSSRESADAAAELVRGNPELARLLEADLGIWAARSGIRVVIDSESNANHHLVQDRDDMLTESTGSDRLDPPSGGPLALGGLSEERVQQFLELLLELTEYLRPLDGELAGLPRGPPVVVLDVAAAAHRLPAEMVEVLERLVAFGWRDPRAAVAADGVVVMTEAMVAEIRDHVAAGRLDEGWLAEVIEHEVLFHLGRGTPAGHDEHAAAVAAGMVLARLRAGMEVPGLRVLHNGKPESLDEDLRRVAVGADPPPVPVGSSEAVALLASSLEPFLAGTRPVIWVVRLDGTLWLGRGPTVHAALADAGGPVVAAGEVVAQWRGGRLVGLGINGLSGHYTRGATAPDDPVVLGIGRSAFARYRVAFPAEPALAENPDRKIATKFPYHVDPLLRHHEVVAAAGGFSGDAAQPVEQTTESLDELVVRADAELERLTADPELRDVGMLLVQIFSVVEGLDGPLREAGLQSWLRLAANMEVRYRAVAGQDDDAADRLFSHLADQARRIDGVEPDEVVEELERHADALGPRAPGAQGDAGAVVLGRPRKPRGGASAVLRDTGEGTRLASGQDQRVQRLLTVLPRRQVPHASPAYRLADPHSVWGGLEYQPVLYAVTGLNHELRDEPFAVVLYVAPDPHRPGRLAVFVDAEVLARMPLLTEGQRGLLAERELARLRGVDEDQVQWMPLPPAAALLALVRPDLGAGLVAAPMPEMDRHRAAVLFAGGLGRRRASAPGGKVVVDWASWSRFEQLGLGRLRSDMVTVTVFDVHGRRWTAMFRHTRAELDHLINGRFLPEDFDRFLDSAESDATRQAMVVALLTGARIRRDEVARARQLERREAVALGSLRALLAQVAGNPGVTLDQLRKTVLPVPVERARAVMALLARLGLVRIGKRGDSFGPVQRVTALLGSRAWTTDDPSRVLLDALLTARPALWDDQLTARVRLLFTLLSGMPDLGLGDSSPSTYLDALHLLAATPSGIGIDEATGIDPATLATLRAAGLVTLVGPADLYQVGRPIRRLLGDLANLDEIEEPDYQRELIGLAGLLEREPADRDGMAVTLAEALVRLHDAEGSPLHPDADRGGLWEPGPTSYGALLLVVRDRPGINALDVATALGVRRDYARASARRLARVGLIQIVRIAKGGEYYLLRNGVAEQITALETPESATGGYRAALLDLTDLLMSEQPHRPSLRDLAGVVRNLGEMEESPLESTGRADDLYEPPVVSYLDLLVAIGVKPGSGALELSGVLGVGLDRAAGRNMVMRLAPGLVIPTRRAMEWSRGTGMLLLPAESILTPTHPFYGRTKFLYELTDLGELFLAALDDPAAALPEPRDQAVLHRIGMLLRSNPGRDRINWTALIDAIARLLTSAEHAPIPLLTRQTPVRGILDAVAAADGWVSARELTGHVDAVIRLKLARFAQWGLLELTHAANHTALYRMPEHTRQLLHDLDYRATILDRRYRELLEKLAVWFDRPLSLDARKLATQRISTLLERIRDIPEGPLPAVLARRVSIRELLDVIRAAGHEGSPTVALIEATSIDQQGIFDRLHALYSWGLVDRRVDQILGWLRYRYRYFLPEHAVRLLDDLDNRVLQADIHYLMLLDELAEGFDKSIKMRRSVRAVRLKAVIDAIRNISDGPLPTDPSLHIYPSTLRSLFNVLVRDGELRVVEIVAALPTVSDAVVGFRVITLFEAGMLGRRAVVHKTARSRNVCFVYFVPRRVQQLLADVDNRARAELPGEYVTALDELNRWLTGMASLYPGREQAEKFVKLVEAIRDMDASPLPPVWRAPMSSYRGTLDAIADAGQEGMTAEELAVMTGIGIVPMRARLRLLLGWKLVERTTGAGRGSRAGSKVYRLPAATGKLLLALDNPTNYMLEDSQQRLRGLAELLNTPTARLGPGSRDRIAKAIDAVRAMRNSPLRRMRTGPSPESVWATLIALDTPNGATARYVGGVTGIGGKGAGGRLHALAEWGWVVRLSGTRGVTIRYGLTSLAQRLLEDLDDLGGIDDRAYQVAAAGAAEALSQSVGLRPGQPGTEKTFHALEAVRPFLVALLVETRPYIAEDSVWATLDAVITAGHPVSAEDLATTTGMLALPAMRHRLHVLADWGLLHVGTGPRGRLHYRSPDGARDLLADLADPDRIVPADSEGLNDAELQALLAYQAAARVLAPLLAENANLRPESPKTDPLARAVAVLFELDAGPVAGLAPRVPADSLWGSLLALAAADRPVTVGWLTGKQELSKSGIERRLSALGQLGLVVREVDWERGDVVFSLAESAPKLLGELADPGGVADDAYRGAVERLVVLLSTPTHMHAGPTREKILTGIDAILAVPGGPLAALFLRIDPDSIRTTLTTIAAAAEHGLTIGELGGPAGMRRRVNGLHRMGLVDRHRNPDTDSTEKWRYTVTTGAGELIVELDLLATPQRIEPNRLALLWPLAGLLNRSHQLGTGSPARRQITEILSQREESHRGDTTGVMRTGLQSSPVGVLVWLTGIVITLGPFPGGVGPWLSLAVITGLAVGLVWAGVGLVRRVGSGTWAWFARSGRADVAMYGFAVAHVEDSASSRPCPRTGCGRGGSTGLRSW